MSPARALVLLAVAWTLLPILTASSQDRSAAGAGLPSGVYEKHQSGKVTRCFVNPTKTGDERCRAFCIFRNDGEQWKYRENSIGYGAEGKEGKLVPYSTRKAGERLGAEESFKEWSSKACNVPVPPFDQFAAIPSNLTAAKDTAPDDDWKKVQSSTHDGINNGQWPGSPEQTSVGEEYQQRLAEMQKKQEDLEGKQAELTKQAQDIARDRHSLDIERSKLNEEKEATKTIAAALNAIYQDRDLVLAVLRTPIVLGGGIASFLVGMVLSAILISWYRPRYQTERHGVPRLLSANSEIRPVEAEPPRRSVSTQAVATKADRAATTQSKYQPSVSDFEILSSQTGVILTALRGSAGEIRDAAAAMTTAVGNVTQHSKAINQTLQMMSATIVGKQHRLTAAVDSLQMGTQTLHQTLEAVHRGAIAVRDSLALLTGRDSQTSLQVINKALHESSRAWMASGAYLQQQMLATFPALRELTADDIITELAKWEQANHQSAMSQRILSTVATLASAIERQPMSDDPATVIDAVRAELVARATSIAQLGRTAQLIAEKLPECGIRNFEDLERMLPDCVTKLGSLLEAVRRYHARFEPVVQTGGSTLADLPKFLDYMSEITQAQVNMIVALQRVVSGGVGMAPAEIGRRVEQEYERASRLDARLAEANEQFVAATKNIEAIAASLNMTPNLLTSSVWLHQNDAVRHLVTSLAHIPIVWDTALKEAADGGFVTLAAELDLGSLGTSVGAFAAALSSHPVTDIWEHAIRGLWTGRDGWLNTVYRAHLVVDACYRDTPALQRLRTALGEINWALFSACAAVGVRMLEVDLFQPPPPFSAQALLMDSGIRRLEPMRKRVRALLDKQVVGFVVDVISVGYETADGQRQPPRVCVASPSDWL